MCECGRLKITKPHIMECVVCRNDFQYFQCQGKLRYTVCKGHVIYAYHKSEVHTCMNIQRADIDDGTQMVEEVPCKQH